MDCPRCFSTNFHPNGHTPKGSKRFRCRDCGKSWITKTLYKDPGLPCPKCDSTETIKNGVQRREKRHSLQNWRCKGCGNSFSVPLEGERVVHKELGAICPSCEYCNTVKNGTSPRVKPPPAQNHLCRNCGRSFSTDKVS